MKKKSKKNSDKSDANEFGLKKRKRAEKNED